METLMSGLGRLLDFSDVLNVSIAASWLVLVVLIFRSIFKKAPKWTRVAMWGLVAFRLLCPFSIESALSLIPSAKTIPEELLRYEGEALREPAQLTIVTNPVISETVIVELPQSVDRIQTQEVYMNFVWWGGMIAMTLYTVISYSLLRKKVGTAVRFRDNIFQSEYVRAPFVLGIIKPKIFVPYQMAEEDLPYVIAHEQTHINRKDHWWKPFGFMLLTIHWFNPLMWLAYVLFCRDIELACDEKVIKELKRGQRADYSKALLSCSVNRKVIAPCPLAFGEAGVKERVKNVLNYRKPSFLLVLAVVLAGMVVAVCFLTDPITDTVEAKDGVKVEETVADSGFASLGYENYNDNYSDTYIASFAVALGEEVTDCKVYIEQWYEGTCVAGIPMELATDTTELNVRMRSSMDGSNGEVALWTDKFAGEWITAMEMPNTMLGWHFETYGAGQEIVQKAQNNVILAVMAFDDGSGICDSVLKEPQKLKGENGYVVVVRAVLGSGASEGLEGNIDNGEVETDLQAGHSQEALDSILDLSEAVEVKDKAKKVAYIEALERICYERVSPLGDEWMLTGKVQFAIYDIDSDEREELLILHDDGVMASMSFEVYDYDEKKDALRSELTIFPTFMFYDNGTIEAFASHNHGMAAMPLEDGGEEFWPYSVYQYNKKTDTYEYVLNVDAWQKAQSETAWTGEVFQEKADKDGDGVLYYIMTDGKYDYDEPIDGAEYWKWRKSIFGNPFEIDVKFVDLPYILPEAAA